MKTANAIRQYFPETVVEGDIFPPPPIYALIARLASYMFFIGLILVFFGEQISNSVGDIPIIKDIIQLFAANKMQACIALYLLNVVGASLLSTGAFEVYVGDELIYSKIDSGQMPSRDFLIQEIAKLS